MFSRLDLKGKGRMPDDSKRATRVSPRASGWRSSMSTPIGFVTHVPRAPLPSLHRATPVCDRVAAPQAMCGLSQRRGKTPSERGYSVQSSSPKLLGTSVLDSTKASDRDNTLSRRMDKSSWSSYRTLPYPPVSLPCPHPSARAISPLSQQRHMSAFFAYASTPVTLLDPVPSSVTAEPRVLEPMESNRMALTRKVIDRKLALHGHSPYPLPKDSQSKIAVAARRTPSPFDHSSPLTSPALIDSPLSSVGFARAPSVTPSISSMDSDSPPTPVLPFAQLDESIGSERMAGSTSPQSADFLSAWLSFPDDERTLDLFPTLDFKEPLFDPKFCFETSNVDFKQLRLGREVFPEPVIVEVADSGVLSSPSLAWSI
ncbi:hypothetical protein WOLCODRAFT_135426 [Wolfiporia cocos MD-104 SS10]|uniref:Uncharacterized protein n=1 Tax=Wolfiporia cocos (strain MD-104) TaxID=742152 RepID=A0A2H3J8K5_WOLCO|nr:hypothetical protein WOLCODRAFT_135426 [Wolfiporia cocos MD-104 SS10]